MPMMSQSERLPLLVDVDGVINVSPSHGEASDDGLVAHTVQAVNGISYRLLIHPGVGELLLSLTDIYELAWCTTWKNANQCISPLLGLPQDLRCVPMPTSLRETAASTTCSAKVPYIRRWATDHGVESLAWIDDDIQVMDTRVLMTDFSRQRRHPMASAPALLDALALKIPPERGLGADHIQRLREWADG